MGGWVITGFRTRDGVGGMLTNAHPHDTDGRTGVLTVLGLVEPADCQSLPVTMDGTWRLTGATAVPVVVIEVMIYATPVLEWHEAFAGGADAIVDSRVRSSLPDRTICWAGARCHPSATAYCRTGDRGRSDNTE